MTSNSTTPHHIPPLKGLSETERDKYLLIGTFLSVLIIFGVIVAVMHKKCRDTMVRTKGWIISKTVRHRPPSSRSAITRSVMLADMTFRDPSSPVFSKEINPPVLFHVSSSSESLNAKSKRSNRRSGTSLERDSSLSIISNGQYTPAGSHSNRGFSFDKDVNDNILVKSSNSVKPQKASLIKVLPPESTFSDSQDGVSANQPSKKDGRKTLRRSSTVIDKLNYMQGYIPSNRDDDFTVITLSDDSEHEVKYFSSSHVRYHSDESICGVEKTSDSSSRLSHRNGIDNPAFYLRSKLLSKSLSDIHKMHSSDEQSSSEYAISSLGERPQNPNDHVVIAEIHTPLKIRRTEQLYRKKDNTRSNDRAIKCKSYPMKSFDKESQELYNRLMRERIQEMLFSDSSVSSVKSDQTFVRNARKKKRKQTVYNA